MGGKWVMYNYYSLEIIPIILNRFKVNNIVLKGILDNETMNSILKYCDNNNCIYNDILSQRELNLSMLLDLHNYDAIFLNDDPNWYTVFNELNIIKKNNEQFPLVFICHNIFPHKRRDSYINPDFIPEKFRNEYSKNFKYGDILLNDGFYHSIKENTSKNGVLTAIEDFLADNASIGVMDIKFLNGITILYPMNSISYFRLQNIFEEINEYQYTTDLSDIIIEKRFLLNQFSQFNSYRNNLDCIDNIEEEYIKKEKVINKYMNKIKLHDDELSYKNSQISNIDSKLSLKDAKIKNFESKLVNNKVKINNLNNQLKDMNNQLQDANNQLRDINNQFRIKQKELTEKKKRLDLVECNYNKQLSKLDSKEYCIDCYKEEIANNKFEIDYLSKDSIARKICIPLSYIYLLFKSNHNDLFLNLKLYRALKNSKCFDRGYYLNKNKDLRGSQWCKYFSPELHYVCSGFYEKRKFNKKYYDISSKKNLLDYIINCTHIE